MKSDRTTDLFRALADPTRRGLFEQLCREGQATVSALTTKAGVSQPVVSKHMRQLKEAGLVSGEISGRETHYRARPEALAGLDDWTVEMRQQWETSMDRLTDLLKRMDQ